MPAVEEHLTDEQTREISDQLLQTIKIPRGGYRLAHKNLPKSQYDVDTDSDIKEEDDENDSDTGFKLPRRKFISKPEPPPPGMSRALKANNNYAE